MALPTNKIKKIKLPNSTEAYEIIPERLQNNGFEASLPTLSTNSTIALKSDVDNSVKKSGDSMSGNLNPATNKGVSLGTSSLFWNNIYGTTLYENGTSLVDKYANKSHAHSYAASDTVGGPANSVKNALTFGSKTYDGSSAQTITASDLGALTSHQDISGKANSSDVYTKSETDNKINKPLYNLGAYDTISGNVITRQTGYLKLDGVNVKVVGVDYSYYISFNFFSPNKEAFTLVASAFGVSTTTDWDANNGFYFNPAADYRLTLKATGQSAKTIDEWNDYFNQNPVYIQYKLTTTYTEEIIEGQPLITLDQQGSQWLRDEWEKGLNVFDIDTATIGNGYDYTATASDWVKAIDIPVEPNTTYTASSIISRYAFNHGNIVADYNKNTITTGSDTITLSLFMYVGDYSGTARTWFSNYMLNKGSIAYPYQAYNYSGHIENEQGRYLIEKEEEARNLFSKEGIDLPISGYIYQSF